MKTSVENTFRAINGQELLVSRFLCRFGNHKWTKYSEPIKEIRETEICCIQKRYCIGCGLYDFVQIWTKTNWNAS